MGKGEKQQLTKEKKSRKGEKKSEKVAKKIQEKKSKKSEKKDEEKKPKDGSNKIKTLTQSQQKVSEKLKSFAIFGKEMLSSLNKQFSGVREEMDGYKFSAAQTRALTESTEAEMNDYLEILHSSRSFVKQLQGLGRSPVLIEYVPNQEFPTGKIKKHAFFKEQYNNEHPGATKEQRDKAWEALKKNPEDNDALELKVRVAKWDKKVKIYKMAEQGRAKTHTKKHVPLLKPAAHPVITRKSEKVVTNLVKKNHPDLSEEDLKKKVDEAVKNEEERYESDLKKAAEMLKMDVDELRSGAIVSD